jgi:tetratricopeptide (TPR) repeat protein
MEVPESRRADLATRVDEARLARDVKPEDPERWVWLGRQIAYTGRFRDAIGVYTEAIERFPENAALYRHRGHRRISLREYAGALDDLTRAAALVRGKPDVLEPPGDPTAPNARADSLHHNIFYHLGLAHYLRGENAEAELAYRQCLDVSKDDESRVSALHWLCCTLRRLGRKPESDALLAPIRPDLDIKENRSYLNLVLLYKGLRAPDEALTGSGASGAAAAYGVGNWLRDAGDEPRGRQVLFQLLAGHEWYAFGYLAAEADLTRAGLAIPR